MVSWDPATYLDFSAERSRPFHDLLARVGAHDPHRVVDLGRSRMSWAWTPRRR
jgi:trans-aconitate 2-methyltransferase